jgi:UDP-2,4-diacetamido-2,4,6-trideoxy-beta-L-altropyranose hydrolase
MQEGCRIVLRNKLTLREASEDDLLLVHSWNNDPEVRQHSFNTEQIPLESHSRWFRAKLCDPKSRIYIAEIAGVPAAQIRFDIKGIGATISYLISREFRGKGLGHIVLMKGTEMFRRDCIEVEVVEGLVQWDNVASIRAFEKAGFIHGQPDPNHSKAHCFVLTLTKAKDSKPK